MKGKAVDPSEKVDLRMRWTRGACATLLLTLTVAGCSSDGGTVADRLRACGLLSEGVAPPLPFYAPDECYQDCLSQASCDELEGVLCGTSIVLPRRCDGRCAFQCGNGALIALEQVCDGVEQCEDASDERSCTMDVCGDGTPLAWASRCDGVFDCRDRSDEQECPALSCDDNRTSYPASARCDRHRNCADGSDERGCGEVTATCEDGG